MAAAITVIIASQLGLPVSSTHIAIGGILGVGFLREYIKASHFDRMEEIKLHHVDNNPEEIEVFLTQFKNANIKEKGAMLEKIKRDSSKAHLTKKERKALREIYQKELVKRSALLRIAAAWVITVPASGLMAALIFFTIRGMMV